MLLNKSNKHTILSHSCSLICVKALCTFFSCGDFSALRWKHECFRWDKNSAYCFTQLSKVLGVRWCCLDTDIVSLSVKAPYYTHAINWPLKQETLTIGRLTIKVVWTQVITTLISDVRIWCCDFFSLSALCVSKSIFFWVHECRKFLRVWNTDTSVRISWDARCCS